MEKQRKSITYPLSMIKKNRVNKILKVNIPKASISFTDKIYVRVERKRKMKQKKEYQKQVVCLRNLRNHK